MAQEEEVAEIAPAPKNKKKLIVMLLVLVVALVVGGSAAVLLLGGKSKKNPGREDAHETVKTVIVPIDEKFTVNIQSADGSSHYLQVPKMELEVANSGVAKEVEAMKSKISDRISSVLRQKSMEEMLAPGSDVKLKEELKDIINKTIGVSPGEVAKNGVHEVILPASFIVQ